jgi:hypothetical protein
MALCALSVVIGCANLTSIERRTGFPEKFGPGRAIHHDKKQRLVITKRGPDGTAPIVCAEPSPDALSAFASAAGGGGGVTGEGSASAAYALSEAGSSVGLRTQSITLMRDAMYRICEAYYNGQLSASDVKLLLTRSQDLTAAVVSIEQLTGAIVAQQAALGGGAQAASSATMLSNAQALAQARALEVRYKQELEATEKAHGDAVLRRDDARKVFDAAAPVDREAAKQKLDKEDQAVRDLERDMGLKRQQFEDVRKAREAIELQQDSSISTASAATSSAAALSGGSTTSTIDKDTAQAIANAVQAITLAVMNKPYISAECMAILSAKSDVAPDLKAACTEIIYASAGRATKEELRAGNVTQDQLEALKARVVHVMPPAHLDRVERAVDYVWTLDDSRIDRLADAFEIEAPNVQSKRDAIIDRLTEANPEELANDAAVIKQTLGKDL